MSAEDEAPLDPGYVDEDHPAEVERIFLRSADAMTPEEYWKFRLTAKDVLVVLVGEFKVGKTSLIAQLYRRFLAGNFADYGFVGSRTLNGFARLDHLATVNSGRKAPTTPRTSGSAGVGYLHLEIRKKDSEPVNLIVSDRSGETFESMRSNTAIAATISEIPQADRICFLLDASKLISDRTRANYGRAFKTLIRSVRDNCNIRDKCVIEIVMTKVDRVNMSDPKHVEIIRDFEKSLTEEFSNEERPVACYRVSAMPRSNYSIGQVGLADLVKRWADSPPIPVSSPISISDAPRQIDNLLARAVII